MLNLDTKIEEVPKIGPAYQKKLKKLGIKTIQDLLFYFPARYDDFSDIIPINQVKVGETICVQGKIISIDQTHTFKRGMEITEVIIEDETGQIPALWFNQPFLAKSLKEDGYICLAGKVSLGKDGIYLSNPAHEIIYEDSLNENLTHTGRIIPVYSETKGVTSRWLRYILKPLLVQFYSQVPEILPKEIAEKHKFLPVSEAIWQAHFPESFEFADAAKARFAFEDLFLLQLSVLKEKNKLLKNQAPACPMDAKLMKEFTSSLPFTLTDSQRQCSFQILKDLEKSAPMSRLLQGDVGSGKTVVGAMAALNVVKNGHQVAFMAPTEILAKQHFLGIIKMLEKFNVTIGYLTGKEASINKGGKTTEIKKKDLLLELQFGQIDILIGTHALISKKVFFSKLALVILDEQHRFGVAQRQALGRGPSQTETQTYAEHEAEFLYENISYKIRKCLFAIKKELGLGHKEIIYQKALAEKFKNENVKFEQEKTIPIMYNDKKIGVYQPDFIIESKIILELKALPFTGDIEKKQVWNYLKGSDYKLALLANFSPKDIEITRIVYDTAREGQRKSASSLRESANRWIPHLLSMTATPIPRTLALTVYGDLDLSLIKEMPKDRKKIITTVVDKKDRQKAYDFIKNEVSKGRGVFVIFPRIEAKEISKEPVSGSFVPQNYAFGFTAKEEIKSVKQEYERLSKEVFPDLRITMLYGKMKAEEKELIMQDFKKGEIDILLSTSVVEVGVDVQRATVMMIEGAERFGLSQLHQFRGRVGRSDLQSYCFLFTTEESQQNRQRLKAMEKSSNGFELAEEDLKIRGPGSLYGVAQSGLPDVAMQNLSNIFLIEKTRSEAKELLEKDPELKDYPLLKSRLKQFTNKIHFE